MPQMLIGALQPDWVVMRGLEFAWMRPEEQRVFEEHYALAAVYDVREDINSMDWLPGRGFLLFDAYFGIWRRKSP